MSSLVGSSLFVNTLSVTLLLLSLVTPICIPCVSLDTFWLDIASLDAGLLDTSSLGKTSLGKTSLDTVSLDTASLKEGSLDVTSLDTNSLEIASVDTVGVIVVRTYALFMSLMPVLLALCCGVYLVTLSAHSIFSKCSSECRFSSSHFCDVTMVGLKVPSGGVDKRRSSDAFSHRVPFDCADSEIAASVVTDGAVCVVKDTLYV